MAELGSLDTPREDLIDRQAILDRFEGDQDLLREIIGLFLEDCPRRVSEMRDALARGDSEALQHVAHSIRGSVGNFAAAAAVDAAVQLETMGRTGDMAHADEACAALERQIALLIAALASLT